jgi:hypothetical protein
MKQIYIIGIMVLMGIAACAKYADGPKISVLPRKERIEGKWMAGSVKYNSIDSTSSYKSYIWEFTRNYTVIEQIGAGKRIGYWSTVTNDKDFRIDYDDGIVEQYEIRKLTKDEFWLRNKKTQFDFQLKAK